ncbi:MAG: glycosyltransferase family 2 protein [Planctomycetota bacterium]|nr:glycosyltransferase family 2 protein [Planctomycetota bacterium]
MPWTTILGVMLLVMTGGVLTLWLVIAYRVHRMASFEHSIRKGIDLPEPEGGWPKLSVIIPAHNEEAMIDRCVESLRTQAYPNLELIFVCDRCTDGTVEILRKHAALDDRLVIIENESCPDDWAGKCNAARLGATKATGAWLLFSDADTHFEKDLCRASMARAIHEHYALVSLMTTLTTVHRFERIVQPVASMNLMRMFPLKRINRKDGSRPFANGQFMLFNRDFYEQVGGHASVKDDLLEDIAISRVISDAGGRIGLFFADHMLTCEMYDTFEAFKEGWKRIYIEACKRKPTRLRKLGFQAIAMGGMAPIIQVGALGYVMATWNQDRFMGLTLVVFVGVGWVTQIMTLMRINDLSGAPRLSAFAYPYANVVVGRIMFQAARDLVRRKPIRWGGREYILEAR